MGFPSIIEYKLTKKDYHAWAIYHYVELNRSAVVAVRLSFSSFCSRVSLQFRRCY